MVVHEGSHPSRQGRPLSRRSIPDKLFHAIKELVDMGADLHAALHSVFDLMEDAVKVSFSEQNFQDGEFLYDRFPVAIDVGPEVKLFLDNCVLFVGSLEVFSELGDWDIQIYIVVFMQDSGDQVNKNAIGTILIRCQLNLHCPELHSPTDVVVNRNLEPH
jgi:hypothetical protein